MKKRFRWFMIALIISVMLGLTGCWDHFELNNLAIILGVGIDKASSPAGSPGQIKMTAQIEKSSETGSPSSASSGSMSETSKYLNVQDTGNSVSNIITDLSHILSRRPYIAQNQIIVFGNDLAKEGIRDSIDYFLRNYEGRLDIRVYTAKGKAEEILTASPLLEDIPAMEVRELSQIQFYSSESADLDIAELMADLVSPTKSIVMPCLETVYEDGKHYINMSGSVVFKEDKMVGELDKKETRGYLWVMDKIKTGKINVNFDGEQAVIKIIKSETTVEPVMSSDGSVCIKIKVKEQGNLSSQTGPVSAFSVNHLQELNDLTDKAIQDEIQLTLNKSFQMGTDIYGFGDLVYKKYPNQWKSMESRWNELYPHLSVQISVTSQVQGGGRLSNPDYPEEEVQK